MNINDDDVWILKWANGGMPHKMIADKLGMSEYEVSKRIKNLKALATASLENGWQRWLGHHGVTISQLSLLMDSLEHTGNQLKNVATLQDLVGCGIGEEKAQRILQRFIVLRPFQEKPLEEMDTEIDDN